LTPTPTPAATIVRFGHDRDVTSRTVCARRSSVVRSAAATSSTAKTTPAKTTTAKVTEPTKTTTAKATKATKATPVTATVSAAGKPPAAKAPAAKAPATKARAKNASAGKVPAAKVTAQKVTADAPAKTDGDPVAPARSDWTAAELTAIRAELSVDIAAMQVEYERSLAELDELQQAGTDGAGDDQADAGSKTFDREQELSIVANRFDLMSQMMHAVERIDHGTYGYCEVCGNPIPRVRLQAFPMATLDVACKQREERR
jgi:RNA polymerase-binding transcription factor DksA